MKYEIEKGPSETWTWIDHVLSYANDDEKKYERHEMHTVQKAKTVHEELSWWNEHFAAFAPFAFEIDAASLRRKWTLVIEKKLESSVLIEATPRTAAYLRSHRKCKIKLDTASWRATALKYGSGGVETLYFIQEWNEIPKTDCQTAIWTLNDFECRDYRNVGERSTTLKR